MGSRAKAEGKRAPEIMAALRELRIQLSLLNHQIASHVALKDIDVDCFELLTRDGPMSPTALARRAGLHPATMTGILDRLERGGWVTRERDSADRRAVAIHPARGRIAEFFRLYAGMGTAVDDICAGYSQADLDLVADFLRRATEAGRVAAEGLAAERPRAFA